MANRFFENRSYTLEKATVSIYGVITCTGGNGAQTLTRAKGITSVTQSSTGIWTIVFQDLYNALLSATVEFLSPAGTVSDWYIKTWTPSTGTLVAQIVSPAGASTSPANTNVGYLEFVFSNSTAL